MRGVAVYQQMRLCFVVLKLSRGPSFSPMMRDIWPELYKIMAYTTAREWKMQPHVSLWKTIELRVRKAKVKVWVWQFLGYQERTGCNEGGRAIIAHSRHWETTKACAELVSWPAFPNDSIQAKVMPFTESLFTLFHLSPLSLGLNI